MKRVKSLLSKYRELRLYGLIGGICATLDLVVFSALKRFIPDLIANVISVHVGIITSFCLNRKYNFKVEDKFVIRFFSFYLIGLSGLLISESILYYLTEILLIKDLVSKLFSIVIVALYQFLLNKFVTFKKK